MFNPPAPHEIPDSPEVADGIGLEGLVAFDLGQSADAVAHEASVQRGTGQVRDRGLQRIKAVIERQQRMAPEGNNCGLLFGCQHRGADDLGTHRRIVHEGSLAPLGNRLLVEPVLGR